MIIYHINKLLDYFFEINQVEWMGLFTTGHVFLTRGQGLK